MIALGRVSGREVAVLDAFCELSVAEETAFGTSLTMDKP